MPVFLDNTLVVLFLSILRMLRDGSLMSCILKEPLPEREREILVHFLALVTTMVTKVGHRLLILVTNVNNLPFSPFFK